MKFYVYKKKHKITKRVIYSNISIENKIKKKKYEHEIERDIFKQNVES